MKMSAGKPDCPSGMMLLREAVRRPLDYGLDYRHASLTNVLAFSARNADCVRQAEASAWRKLDRCGETSRPRRSSAARVERLLSRQLLEVKHDLAWAELDHRLGVGSRYWNADRYARLAKGLCVLAALWRYRRSGFPEAPPVASRAAAARLARLWQLKERGWKALQDHLDRSGLDWRAGIAAHLRQARRGSREEPGATRKVVRDDRDGNAWMIKYSPESLVNPVLASLFARLSGCPGAEICPSFLDYDPRRGQPCSVQPYVRAQAVARFDGLSRRSLVSLIGGDRRRASQILCQAVVQWILENIDGNQAIIDGFGNCVGVDQDRSFFIDDHRATTDWQAAWVARNKVGVSVVPAKLIEATASIPGVLDDLSAFIVRVEAVPAAAYEGLVRNASFREEQLCSLFYLDVMDARALGSVRALERWIDHLLARKARVRGALARRLREVLGRVECRL
jgi:hypothetical protein